MGYTERIPYYEKIEGLRGKPLVVYITSNRVNAGGEIAGDVIPELVAQLDNLPDDTKELDLLLVSNGGDPTVAWRIVSLIRERVEQFSVLIPDAAFSAATLICLGANEIYLHRNGNLGPTDAQIVNREKKIAFGAEDLAAFLRFAKEQVGLTEQAHLLEVFREYSREAGPLGIGVAARSIMLSTTLGEKLLTLHMGADKKKIKAISEKLSKEHFHHGYPISRTEALELGLPVAQSVPDVDALISAVWADIVSELELRQPFLPMALVKKSPAGAVLFSPISTFNVPQGTPQHLIQPFITQWLATNAIKEVDPVDFTNIHVVVESKRHATRCVSRGSIFARRNPDLRFEVNPIVHFQGWLDEGKKQP